MTKKKLTPKQQTTKAALTETVSELMPSARILTPVRHRGAASSDRAGRHHTDLRARADAWLAQQAESSADDERGPEQLEAEAQHYARLVHLQNASGRVTAVVSPGTHRVLGARG